MRTFSMPLSGTIARPFVSGAADAAVPTNAPAPSAIAMMTVFILNSFNWLPGLNPGNCQMFPIDNQVLGRRAPHRSFGAKPGARRFDGTLKSRGYRQISGFSTLAIHDDVTCLLCA